MWQWGRYYNQSLLRLRRRHLAAQPRTETRLLRRQTRHSDWEKDGRREEHLREEGSWEEEGALKTGRKDLRGTKEKGCVKWSKKWAAEVKREGAGARRVGAGTQAGVGSSQPTAGVRAAGALSAAPGAGVEGGGGGEERKREQFEGRTRQGQRAHPWPSPAT